MEKFKESTIIKANISGKYIDFWTEGNDTESWDMYAKYGEIMALCPPSLYQRICSYGFHGLSVWHNGKEVSHVSLPKEELQTKIVTDNDGFVWKIIPKDTAELLVGEYKKEVFILKEDGRRIELSNFEQVERFDSNNNIYVLPVGYIK